MCVCVCVDNGSIMMKLSYGKSDPIYNNNINLTSLLRQQVKQRDPGSDEWMTVGRKSCLHFNLEAPIEK